MISNVDFLKNAQNFNVEFSEKIDIETANGNVLVVEADLTTGKASHSSVEICEYLKNGGYAVGRVKHYTENSDIYAFLALASEEAIVYCVSLGFEGFIAIVDIEKNVYFTEISIPTETDGVKSVNGISPQNGNVELSPSDIGAISKTDAESIILNTFDSLVASGSLIGPPGEPGYTPQKGHDYFTPEDISQIVNDVLMALPNGDEVGY